ncbi:helix-turn-helix domain-containing protein [Burkholderia sp. Ac-20345]|uniref:helix-turn-helix transcriptional regulator n=1 Tax=Burkholderia sp. Ac-20345 TaxID=2703891 RepID=UPI00197BBD92|nr:helix-turn-helix domain-containing protein [Burkholderia sp. Ac-20345]MBN3779809.1 helix-turn-helix domain-containing protein [Burkholderia sp. Ac-20345]
MPYVSKTFKAGVAAAAGRDVVLSEELLDLLADRIASRVAARLRERLPAPARRQEWAASPAPAAAELRADRLYRVADVMQRLGVSKATVYNLARDGRLELVKFGRRASGVTGKSLIVLIERNCTHLD